MTLKYESELLFDLMKRDGDDAPSDVLPYESELKEKYLNQVVGAYPKLQDYQPEWLHYNLYHHIPSDFPIESVSNVTSASFHHVVPYAYKNAILKGQTLVNLHHLENHQNIGVVLDGGINQQFGKENLYGTWKMLDISMFKPNTEYGVFFWVLENTLSETYWVPHVYNSSDTVFNKTSEIRFNAGETGLKFIKLTTISDFTGKTCGLRHVMNINTPSSEYVKFQCVIVEYQEGIENWDIQYFEGMQSVKMPVLKATGKNLFDFESFKKEENRILGSKSYSSFKLNLKPNTKYSWNRFSNDGFGSTCYVLINTVLGSSGNALNWLIHSDSEVINYSKGTFNTDKTGVVYISGIINNDNQEKTFELLENLIIIESGTSPVSYEPFKSIILTVNEEVELRGVGDVCDTVDLLTGEVTQRIGEIVLDGSEEWLSGGAKEKTQVFNIKASDNKIINMKKNTTILCDKLKVARGVDEEIIVLTTTIYLGLLKTKASTVGELKAYLSQNPITVQYQLATPTIKTVDLSCINEQGKSETIRPIEGTMHVSTSSQTLKPLLDMGVPVEATTQNLMSFANIEGEE